MKQPKSSQWRVVLIVLTLILWVATIILTINLADERYDAAVARPPGIDFRYVLHAAKDVAVNRSPYLVPQYVYPPVIALGLAPFSHIRSQQLWRDWVAFMIIGPIIAVAFFILLWARRLVIWLQPILCMFCIFTVLYSQYYPLSRDLLLGESDTMIFPVLLLAALSAGWSAPAVRGFIIGVGGLLKVWPGAIGLALFQRGYKRRWQALWGLGITLLLAPLSTAVLWGFSGLHGFIANVFNPSNQTYSINDSVWGATKLLFSNSHLARPLLTSSILHILVLAILLIWVIWLLVLILRSKCDPVLGTFYVLFCILLLLPISHRQYAIFVLPILWLWLARWLQNEGGDRRTGMMTSLLLFWWIIQTVPWPYSGSSYSISALYYIVPFVVDLAVLTVSILVEIRYKPVAPVSRHPIKLPDSAS